MPGSPDGGRRGEPIHVCACGHQPLVHTGTCPLCAMHVRLTRLRPYVRHRDGCPAPAAPCACGLDAALAGDRAETGQNSEEPARAGQAPRTEAGP